MSRIICGKDHPRSRGVYRRRPWATARRRGSSPLARGLPVSVPSSGDGARIIPARAGFTSRHHRSGASPPDHPRSRGVYEAGQARSRRPLGSSPLARGLRRACRHSRRGGGIIPARAGFTGALPQARGRIRDHPRSRGVYVAAGSMIASALGSSPLARGLHRPGGRGRPARGSSPLARGLPALAGQPSAARGIIPARAGFTVLRKKGD